MDLTYCKLLKKFGTKRTYDNFNEKVQQIEHFLEIEDKEPTDIRTVSLHETRK